MADHPRGATPQGRPQWSALSDHDFLRKIAEDYDYAVGPRELYERLVKIASSLPSETRLATSDPDGHAQAIADGEHDALIDTARHGGRPMTLREVMEAEEPSAASAAALIDTPRTDTAERIHGGSPLELNHAWATSRMMERELRKLAAEYADLKVYGRTASSARLATADLDFAPQLALDQQSDDPAPGDWNAACRHIASLLRECAIPVSSAAPAEGVASGYKLVAIEPTHDEISRIEMAYLEAMDPDETDFASTPKGRHLAAYLRRAVLAAAPSVPSATEGKA